MSPCDGVVLGACRSDGRSSPHGRDATVIAERGRPSPRGLARVDKRNRQPGWSFRYRRERCGRRGQRPSGEGMDWAPILVGGASRSASPAANRPAPIPISLCYLIKRPHISRLTDGVAQLCGAATAPAHRRHGVQSALVTARLRDATDVGCDVAVVTTAPGSTSQKNVQRNGFHLLYTRAILFKAAAVQL